MPRTRSKSSICNPSGEWQAVPMARWIARFVLIAAAIGVAVPAGALPMVSQQTFRMNVGDNPRWADPALDDAAWPVVRLGDVPETDGIVILRAKVHLEAGDFVTGLPTAVFFGALASYELAWDGVVIGRGGRPSATPAEEIPGPIEAHWAVPDRLASDGEHLVALRCSAHHRHFHPGTGYWTLLIGSYDTVLKATTSGTSLALISLSGMLMVGVFALVMFFVDRRDRSFLRLGIVCIVGSTLLLAESWRSLFGYTYDWQLTRLIVVTALTAALNVSIVLFVLARFPGRGGSPLALALGACLALRLLVPSWDGKALMMFIGGLALSTGWVVRAVHRREHGSVPALVGLGATLAILIWRPFWFANLPLYYALDFLLVCLLVAHALQVGRFQVEREEALVKSARLEIELLRKHIQPHFLMNTLTALSEWIEQDPRTAVKMIESISEEFRILARISNRSMIEMSEELELCRTHIEIMNRRRDREVVLAVEGVDPRDLVPPAIFHTLVENAITHDDSARDRATLRLTARREGDRVRYLFRAPFGSPEPSAAEGTGLRYIRARLRESFDDDWSLEAGPAGDVWRTEIVIPRWPS
jgi:hypothetical protein